MPATGTLPATIGALLKENVHLGVDAADKDELIKRLVGELVSAEEGSDASAHEVAESVLQRESLLSTGVGYGVGLPHAKSSLVPETLVLFATTASPVDFDSVDGEPVQIVFLMVGPPSRSTAHIRILGRVSRILNNEDIRQRLLESSTVAEVIEIFESAEAGLKSA